MTTTNRALNRAVLGVLGVALIIAGALTAAAGFSADVANDWTRIGTQAWAWTQQQLGSARIPNTSTSWWTVAVFGVLLVAAFLLVCWIMSQGGGRTNHVGRHEESDGTTTVESGLAAQAIKDALSGNEQVLSTAVQAWRIRGTDGLKISVQARKGASPRDVTLTIAELVAGLDALLGEQVPVLIRIKAGARTRFARTERVD
jgi:hypothetical protein